MPDLVRVRDKSTKTEFTVGVRRAEQLAERSKDVEILDAPATDRLGRALEAGPMTEAKTAPKSKESTR